MYRLIGVVLIACVLAVFATNTIKAATGPHCVTLQESTGWLHVPYFGATQFNPLQGDMVALIDNIGGGHIVLPMFSAVPFLNNKGLTYKPRSACEQIAE